MECCLQYLIKEKKEDKLPFHFVKIGRWWEKDKEIDIVATNLENNNYIIAECKYNNSKIGIKELNILVDKFKHIAGNKYYYLFSKSGFEESIKKDKNVKLISIDKII